MKLDKHEAEVLENQVAELRDLIFDDASGLVRAAMLGSPAEVVGFACEWIKRAKKGLSLDLRKEVGAVMATAKMTDAVYAVLYRGVKKSWCPFMIFRKFFPMTAKTAAENPRAISDAFRPLCDKRGGQDVGDDEPITSCGGFKDGATACWAWFEEHLAQEVIDDVRKSDSTG